MRMLILSLAMIILGSLQALADETLQHVNYTFVSSSNGVTSFYRHGRRTADGSIFYPEGLSAAHRSLPFGTRVLVTDLSTERSVVVVINDRGPYERGRHIDLSYGAAKAIGMIERGVVRVRITILRL